MAFKIITDSASDTPQWIVDKYDMLLMPTPVVINGEDHFDRLDIFPEQFYDTLRSDAVISTYHISEQMFYDHFKPYAERGDEVLYLCFSTGIAGTFTAATLAYQDLLEEFPEFKMTIIDTRCASMGYGLSAYKLLRMQANGAPKELLIEAAKFFCEHTEHSVTVETLAYLLKGGRISKTSATFGTILGIKPIIMVDKEGRLTAIEKVRGRKASLERILDRTGEVGARLEDQIVAVVHGDDPETAEFLKKELIDRYHCREVVIAEIGCAIGAHTGPGIVGIVCQTALDDRFEQYLKD
ncbi:MAG: DegV family protein [Ruminococcaceae bacterium]|nr:DegV family protein [Oscillospiraceae bacterium]